MVKKLNLLISKSRVRKKEKRFVVLGERELSRAIEMGYKIDYLFIREAFDGEAFFTSAITETPGFFSAFLNDILFFSNPSKD